MREEILSAKPIDEDRQVEQTLRPSSFSEYIGQEKLKKNLKVFIEACKQRNESLDHILLSGPPGLGKTTLASIIARELGVDFRSTSGPVLEKGGDLAAILTNLKDKDLLFIDEIHRLNRTVEEILYLAMEDFQLDIIIGQGVGARTVKISLPKFTLIGATTKTGLLTSPLRDRFGFISRLDFYNTDELKQIVIRSSKILGIIIEDNAAYELAKRSRGTPRIANRLLKRVRDYSQVDNKDTIDLESVKKSLLMLEIDEEGLDTMDRKILAVIIDQFNGGPAGIEAISATLSEDKDTIEDVYEPYLLQKGFINRTQRGRVATKTAYDYLKREFPDRQGNQQKLL